MPINAGGDAGQEELATPLEVQEPGRAQQQEGTDLAALDHEQGRHEGDGQQPGEPAPLRRSAIEPPGQVGGQDHHADLDQQEQQLRRAKGQGASGITRLSVQGGFHIMIRFWQLQALFLLQLE